MKNSHLINCSGTPPASLKSLYAILELDPSVTTSAVAVGEAYDRVSTLLEVEADTGTSAPIALAARKELLDHAHRVLSHPGKRVVYNIFGEQVWDLVVSNRYLDVVLEAAGAGQLAPSYKASVEGKAPSSEPIGEGQEADEEMALHGIIFGLHHKCFLFALAVITLLIAFYSYLSYYFSNDFYWYLLPASSGRRIWHQMSPFYLMMFVDWPLVILVLLQTLCPFAILRPSMYQRALQIRSSLYLAAFIAFAHVSDSSIGVGVNLCILAEIVGLIHSRPNSATIRTKLLVAALNGGSTARTTIEEWKVKLLTPVGLISTWWPLVLWCMLSLRVYAPMSSSAGNGVTGLILCCGCTADWCSSFMTSPKKKVIIAVCLWQIIAIVLDCVYMKPNDPPEQRLVYALHLQFVVVVGPILSKAFSPDGAPFFALVTEGASQYYYGLNKRKSEEVCWSGKRSVDGSQ